MNEQDIRHTKGLTAAVVVLLVVAVTQTYFLARLYQEKSETASSGSQPSVQMVRSQENTTERPTGGPSDLPKRISSKLRQAVRSPGAQSLPRVVAIDPFEEMRRMQEEMDHMFSDSLWSMPRLSMPAPDWGANGEMRLKDEGDRYVVTMDMPGLEKGTMEVGMDGNQLNVSGSYRTDSRQEEGNGLKGMVQQTGYYQRSYSMPGPVLADKMEARYENGVLTVTVPKDNSQTLTVSRKP